jgi:hypothetical protein
MLLASFVYAGEYTGKYFVELQDLTFTQQDGYDIPLLGSYSVMSKPGAPQLPYTDINVAVPPEADISNISVLKSSSSVLEGEFKIRPCAEPRPISWARAPGNSAHLFKCDRAIYGADAEYPGKLVEFASVWDLAGQKFVTFRFYPVQYNPVTGRIRVVEEILFEVTWKEIENPVTDGANYTERGRAIFEGMLTEVAVNPEDVEISEFNDNPHMSALPSGSYEHVIITTDSFKNAWEDLVDWHCKKGVPDTVVTDSWIYSNYSGDNQQRIRSFVKEANQNWGTLWVLIGGDSGKVPYKTKYYVGCSIPTDAYYSDYDDDYKNETFIGRACVDNTTEINTFIDKVLTYEKDPPMSSYAMTAGLYGFDFDWSTPTEEMMKDFKRNNIPSSWDVTEVYDSHSGNHRTNVLNDLNSGPNIINHSDHCNYDVIGVGCVHHDWYLYISDMSGLGNGSKYGNFYSTGCYSNAYQYSDCIGEAFVKCDTGGGTSYIGNSNYGWYNPGSTQTLSCGMDREYVESLFDLGYVRVGQALADSKNRNYPSDDYDKFIWFALNLDGEPELAQWMNNPGTMTAGYASIIPPGYQEFTVCVEYEGDPVEDALVCVRKLSDGIYEYGLTGGNGCRTFSISPTIGEMEVTVTGRDLLPHEGIVEVSGESPLSLTLTPDSTIIDKPGMLEFQADCVNDSESQQHFQAWTELTLWNEKPYFGNPLLGPTWFTIDPGQTITRHFSHEVDESVPSATYKYTAKIGYYPNTVIVEDTFEFEVR